MDLQKQLQKLSQTDIEQWRKILRFAEEIDCQHVDNIDSFCIDNDESEISVDVKLFEIKFKLDVQVSGLEIGHFFEYAYIWMESDESGDYERSEYFPDPESAIDAGVAHCIDADESHTVEEKLKEDPDGEYGVLFPNGKKIMFATETGARRALNEWYSEVGRSCGGRVLFHLMDCPKAIGFSESEEF
jgi:hypothetical protein